MLLGSWSMCAPLSSVSRALLEYFRVNNVFIKYVDTKLIVKKSIALECIFKMYMAVWEY